MADDPRRVGGGWCVRASAATRIPVLAARRRSLRVRTRRDEGGCDGGFLSLMAMFKAPGVLDDAVLFQEAVRLV